MGWIEYHCSGIENQWDQDLYGHQFIACVNFGNADFISVESTDVEDLFEIERYILNKCS